MAAAAVMSLKMEPGVKEAGGGCGDELEDGAGGEGGGDAAVYKRAVALLAACIQRVDRRGGHHAEKLPRAVVAHHHAAAGPLADGLVDLVVEPRVVGEAELLVAHGMRRAGQEAEAAVCVHEAREYARAGAAPVVAGDVVVGSAGDAVGGIDAVGLRSGE